MASVLPFQKEPPFSHGQAPVTGILLCNLGTPDEPTTPAVRRYLREFLSDPRVVEIPRAVWLPLLHGIILPLRSSRSAAKYATIWTPQGSPLKVHTERQARADRHQREDSKIDDRIDQKLEDCEQKPILLVQAPLAGRHEPAPCPWPTRLHRSSRRSPRRRPSNAAAQTERPPDAAWGAFP